LSALAAARGTMTGALPPLCQNCDLK
jgi:hypothetical protein